MLPAVIEENKIDQIINEVVTKKDFVEIEGSIEIKRDLALKLFAFSNLSYDTQVLSSVSNANETVYIVKAKVYKTEGNKVAEGLGACSTDEIKGRRKHHDALARAETRAFKRALEACVGLPIINQIIFKLFGSFNKYTESSKEESLSDISKRKLEDYRERISIIDDFLYLKNWWNKNKPEIDKLLPKDRKTLVDSVNRRKEELTTIN